MAYQSAVSVDVWGLGYRVVIDLALDIDFVSAGIQRHGYEDDEVCVRTQGS